MYSPLRTLLDLVFVGLVVWMQWKLLSWALASSAVRARPRLHTALRLAFGASCVWLIAAGAYGVALTWHTVPGVYLLHWLRGLAIVWALVSGGLFVVGLALRSLPEFNPARRKLLSAALVAVPAAAAGSAVFIERHRFRLVEEEIAIPNLHPDLQGLRLAHLSDIHLGPFLADSELQRVIDMANSARPHLTFVTGDLITSRDDRLTDCLRMLKGLKAEAGVLGCLGNHEIHARCEARTRQEGATLGLDFLRGEVRRLHFGAATLNVGGVDYQRMSRPYLVGADQLLEPDCCNLLLSHNPDVFPVAAEQGWDLTLAGHTHGGQITVDFLHQYLNVARIFTPYIYGSYERSGSSIYVTRGIGTVAVPARIGAPPEIALIRLCAT